MRNNQCKSQVLLLSTSTVGYVVKCSKCREIQFCLGNVFSSMPEKAFICFFNSLKALLPEVKNHLIDLPNGKKIALRTPVENIQLMLSPEEFDSVLDMFATATLKLRLTRFFM